MCPSVALLGILIDKALAAWSIVRRKITRLLDGPRWFFFPFIFNAICHYMLWQTVGVTYQPFHYAPSIAHLCLISISFRRSSVSLSMFICRVNCTPSIDHFCPEHQKPHLCIHVFEPLGSGIHVSSSFLLRASSAACPFPPALSLSFS